MKMTYFIPPLNLPALVGVDTPLPQGETFLDFEFKVFTG